MKLQNNVDLEKNENNNNYINYTNLKNMSSFNEILLNYLPSDIINEIMKYDAHTCCMKKIREREKKEYSIEYENCFEIWRIQNDDILVSNYYRSVGLCESPRRYKHYYTNTILFDLSDEVSLRAILNDAGYAFDLDKVNEDEHTYFDLMYLYLHL